MALPLLVGIRFQVLFTPLAGVLFTFPSRYWFTIGRERVFSLAGWSRQIPAGFPVSRGTQDPRRADSPFAYKAVTSSGRPFQTVRLGSPVPPCGSCNPGLPRRAARFGLFRVRSPLLAESLLFSLPPGTEMVHFPGFAPPAYVFGRRRREFTPARFPHSDIPGSTLAYSSPRLFAVGHVLHRLLSPRHPPYALSSLTVLFLVADWPAPGKPRPARAGRAPAGLRYSDCGARASRRRRIRRLPMTFDIRDFNDPRRFRAGNPVGVAGLEPATSSLSGMRSDRLSYTPPLPGGWWS